jgi:hypothetical protein
MLRAVQDDWQPGGPRQRLTAELLDEYEERLCAHRVPVVEHLRPGLSEDEISSLIAELDLIAPAEALAWWSWHDAAGEQIALGCRFLSLEDGVLKTLSRRDLARELVDRRAGPEWWTEDLLWKQSWLVSLDGDGTDMAIDCDVDPGATSPVHWADAWRQPEEAHEPLTQSMGDLVTRWIAALDGGSMYYDGEYAMWQARDVPGAPRMYQSGRWR